jgi:hypothetical protein
LRKYTCGLILALFLTLSIPTEGGSLDYNPKQAEINAYASGYKPIQIFPERPVIWRTKIIIRNRILKQKRR